MTLLFLHPASSGPASSDLSLEIQVAGCHGTHLAGMAWHASNEMNGMERSRPDDGGFVG